MVPKTSRDLRLQDSGLQDSGIAASKFILDPKLVEPLMVADSQRVCSVDTHSSRAALKIRTPCKATST